MNRAGKKRLQLSYLIIITTILITSVLLIYGLRLVRDLRALSTSEEKLFEESYTTTLHFNDFQRALGFGGYIHNVKEYLLHRNDYQLFILKSNIQEIEASFEYIQSYFIQYESQTSQVSTQQFIDGIIKSYEILINPENAHLDAEELDEMIALEAPEILSSLVTLETFINNQHRRAMNHIKENINELVDDLLLSSILLPAFLGLGLYLAYLLNSANKVKRKLEEAQIQLITSEEWLEETSKTARVGGWEIFSDREHINWTKETYRIFDLEEKKLMTLQESLSFFNQEDQKSIEKSFNRSFSQNVPFNREFPYTSAKGKNGYVQLIFNPYKDLMGQTILRGAIQDISERKELEIQLQQAHKMEAIGQLAGGVAHDFNNLLTGIMNSAVLLNHPMRKLDEKGKKYTNLIITASETAAELVQKLLAFSGKGVQKRQPVNMGNLLNDVVSILKRTIDKTISVELFSQYDCNIMGDAALIQNAMINLGVNASHAMPDGGSLRFEINQVPVKGTGIGSNYRHACEILVIDTGCGIPEEVIDKIFNPFFTTKDPGKGTGLGLSTVFSIIRDHGGYIDVKSSVGEGTSFKITLPCSEEEIIAEEDVSKDISGTGTILLVDDEEIIRITVKAFLETCGFKVLTADNGGEALKLFNDFSDKIDLILLDMIMPGMNGFNLFYHLKELDNECKVVLTTGFADDKRVERMLNDGLLGLIKKPYDNYEMAHYINKLIQDLKVK